MPIAKGNPQITYIDNETFMPYKSYLPFNITHRAKDIIGKDPHTKIETPQYEHFTLEKKKNFLKTKPRVYMPYQICVDDLDDEKYKMYIDHTYTSNWNELVKSSCVKINARPLVYTEVAEKANPLEIVKYNQYKVLNEKQESQIKDWNERQYFKNYKGSSKEGSSQITGSLKPSLNETPDLETKSYIQNLVKDNRLRWAYDKLNPGYAGYKIQHPNRTPLLKSEVHRIDPLLTTLQETQGDYKKF